MNSFDLESIWPKYRYRVEKFDDVFGRENVVVRPFHPWEFRDNSVVLDFADFIGASISQDQVIKANETLTAEATSLLYLQRTLGRGFGAPGPLSVKRNSDWFTKLNEIGTHKFKFSDSLLQPVINHHRDDLDWIEKRIGRTLQEPPPRDAMEISSEQDLIDLALSKSDQVRDLLLADLADPLGSRKMQLVNMLEALRDIPRS